MPLSLCTVEGCSITKGKYYEYLYLMNSSNESILNVDIIDPMIGLTETKNVEQFAKEQGPMKFDNIANLIEPDNVKQIIMINFDESKSMIGDLDGYYAKDSYHDYIGASLVVDDVPDDFSIEFTESIPYMLS